MALEIFRTELRTWPDLSATRTCRPAAAAGSGIRVGVDAASETVIQVQVVRADSDDSYGGRRRPRQWIHGTATSDLRLPRQRGNYLVSLGPRASGIKV